MLFSPGHRPPASEALGWSLPTRWAGGRFSDKAPRNLRARKAERRTSRTPRTAGTRKYRTGYRRSAFEVLAVLVVLGVLLFLVSGALAPLTGFVMLYPPRHDTRRIRAAQAALGGRASLGSRPPGDGLPPSDPGPAARLGGCGRRRG